MSGKILVIDDDQELCEELTEVLQNESYAVDLANDGTRGWNLISSNSYDLVLLDLKIPRMNGIDILKNLKHENPSLKVIVLTGRPLASETTNAQRQHVTEEDEILHVADGIINKPFDVVVLLEKIRELIGPSGGDRNTS